jgi:hypothetical protein
VSLHQSSACGNRQPRSKFSQCWGIGNHRFERREEWPHLPPGGEAACGLGFLIFGCKMVVEPADSDGRTRPAESKIEPSNRV